MELNPLMRSTDSEFGIAVSHIENGGVEPEIPVEDAQLGIEPISWVLACEEDRPEGQKLEQGAPNADEEQRDGVWEEEVNRPEE